MRTVLKRTAAFVAIAFPLSLSSTLLSWAKQEDGLGQELLRQLLPFRVGFHAGELLLTTIGAMSAFALLRHRLPPTHTVIALGAAFGVMSFFAVGGAFHVGGLASAAIWALAGSAVFAYGGALAAPQHDGLVSSAFPLAARSDQATSGTKGRTASAIVGAALSMAVLALLLVPLIWGITGLKMILAYPVLLVIAAPYSLSGGLAYGVLLGSMPENTYVKLRSEKLANQAAAAMALGLISGLAGLVIGHTLGRWMSWGSTTAYLKSVFTLGLLIDDRVIVLWILIGTLCGPILWFLARAVRAQIPR